MAEVTAIFKITPARIDSITLDASISESHRGQTQTTDHPVEKGADITDHVRPQPDTLSLEGVVSNTPLSTSQAGRVVESQGQEFTTTAPDIAGAPGYAEEAYAKLRDLKDSGKLITIVTALRTYDNMVITDLDVPRDGRTGDVLRFSISFKQVKVVQNQVSVVAVEPKAHKKTKLGKQVAKPTEEEAETKASSFLFDTFGDGARKRGLID